MTFEFTHQFNFTKDESQVLVYAFLAMLLCIKKEDALFYEAKKTFDITINQKLIDSINKKLLEPITTM